MTERDELLEQIPLLACGALDSEERARAEEQLARHEDVKETWESYRALDTLLKRTLAPAAAAPSVKRHCPYCKDDLRTEAEVLCTKCLTPHHRSCFSENRGCSLLGCNGTRSVSAEESSLDVCPSCGEHTPSGAPFCAWCRTALGGARLPRHASPVAEPLPPRDLGRFLAACAALLVAGMSIGWFFEARQNVMMDALVASAREARAAQCQKYAETALLAIHDAQLDYRENAAVNKLNSDPSGKFYAPTLDELATVSSNLILASRSQLYSYEIRIVRSRTAPGERFAALALPRNGPPGHYTHDKTLPPDGEREGVFVDWRGRLVPIQPASDSFGRASKLFYTDTVTIDEDTCELVETTPGGRR